MFLLLADNDVNIFFRLPRFFVATYLFFIKSHEPSSLHRSKTLSKNVKKAICVCGVKKVDALHRIIQRGQVKFNLDIKEKEQGSIEEEDSFQQYAQDRCNEICNAKRNELIEEMNKDMKQTIQHCYGSTRWSPHIESKLQFVFDHEKEMEEAQRQPTRTSNPIYLHKNQPETSEPTFEEIKKILFTPKELPDSRKVPFLIKNYSHTQLPPIQAASIPYERPNEMEDFESGSF